MLQMRGFRDLRDAGTHLRFQVRGGDRETDQAPLLGTGGRGGVLGRQDAGDGEVSRIAAASSTGPVYIRRS